MHDVKKPLSGGQIWLLSLLLCMFFVAIAFAYLDAAIARFVYPLVGRLDGLAEGLGSAVLLTLEAITVLTLVIIRIRRGHLPPLSEAVALACLSSICAYAINASVLKVFFGVPTPADVLEGTKHAFNLAQGTMNSSFPSGHMVLAGAFSGVLMRLYRRSILPLFALLLVVATLLILGDWHFLSDVIAGTFVGVSAGLLAGELWLVHSGQVTGDRARQ